MAADFALAGRVIPQPQDLPTGWTLVENEAATGDNLNAPPDACDPTGLFSHQILGWTRAWSYLLNTDGNESGHLTATVKISRSANIVTRQLALLRSAHFQPCEAQNVEENLTAAGVRLTGRTTWSTLPLHLPVPGGAERYVTPYQFQGNNKIAYTDYIVLGVGTARIKIMAQRCCVVPSAQLEDSLIAATAARLRAG